MDVLFASMPRSVERTNKFGAFLALIECWRSSRCRLTTMLPFVTCVLRFRLSATFEYFSQSLSFSRSLARCCRLALATRAERALCHARSDRSECHHARTNERIVVTAAGAFFCSQDDPREALAAKYSLNYVAMDGEIGCMVRNER